jgi:hypothetical protein
VKVTNIRHQGIFTNRHDAAIEVLTWIRKRQEDSVLIMTLPKVHASIEYMKDRIEKAIASSSMGLSRIHR